MKNLIITSSIDFEEKILDPFEGKAELSIDNDYYEEVESLKNLYKEDLENIKEAEDVSIKGIMRLSH